ncbi:tpaE [Sphaerisporangium album]|uniref:TpaE n=1 Tax=Sphaerisporangium album TaxID=509200 RepID=A0A367FLQ5_9ACTN|nr:nitroreductase family protein [Sphaerisporangium album]RCG30555.1 tpaE [Sphaerisporangium album]
MSDKSVITAEAMGEAARFDPQLRVPRRPRVRRGLVISVEDGQVVVEGAPKKQLLRGRSATEMLPALLDRLDGVRDHAELAREIGVTEDVIFKALSLLWTCGIIEEAPPAEDLAHEVDDALADFLSRVGDSTGANAAWEQAAARLQAARVEVFGDPFLAEALCAELGRSMDAVPATGPLPRVETTLVACVGRPDDALAARCWEKGVPLMRLRLSGRRADLGPMADPQITPCLDCLSAGDVTDDRAPVDGDHALAVALFARELFAAVSRSTTVPLPMRWRSVDLETLAQQDNSSATRPGCERCSVAGGPVAARASLAARYEAGVAMPPKEFADLKAHQMHYKPSNLALQRVARTWPVAPAVELPPPAHERLATRASASPLGAEELSLMLSVVAGNKAESEQRVLRWTASGGNIGSVTAYAVVRDVPGVEPGVYGYVGPEHRLARLSRAADAVPGGTPLTLVLSGDFPKVAQKYAAFALRIVLLDSGCAQATAREAARALGLRMALRPAWDDEAVTRVLGVDPDLEPVTAIIDLGGGA